MAQALRNDDTHQLTLDAKWTPARQARQPHHRQGGKLLCAWCQGKEARYGFREDADDPMDDRPRTLCFECFRIEMNRRQAVAARLARGWNAEQVGLPLDKTLNELTRRRRRAQIAARHALGE